VDTSEPRADILAGSLIKNPGGGLAPVGGYIAGKEELVLAAACRLNTPGLGGEAGPTLGFTSSFLQGLFQAPQVVKGALMGAVFAARMFEKLGYETMPGPFEKRSDIVQAAVLKNPANVEAFCAGVQKAAPVDSFVKPEAWDMPGYGCPVIMAAGAFVQGSSIELSADAPMREPYIVFFQGGLSYDHSRAGALIGLNEMAGVK
jgi:cystathionine beta-lyase family protein involved in aluminum resistance